MEEEQKRDVQGKKEVLVPSQYKYIEEYQ